jgi:hypothetical protein
MILSLSVWGRSVDTRAVTVTGLEPSANPEDGLTFSQSGL